MNYHQIGSTGLSLPRVTLGTSAFGNQYQQGTISDELQHFDISIDATILGTGVYTIVSDLYGPVGRFVKM